MGGWAQRVHSFFRQTFEVVPDVHAHIDAQEQATAEPRQFFVLVRAK
jgi:hypothetical protein